MRIAVIDDEKYSRIVLTHQIRQLLPQAEVAQAASGAQAMELLERQSFDVLFIDIRLGDMGGDHHRCPGPAADAQGQDHFRHGLF